MIYFSTMHLYGYVGVTIGHIESIKVEHSHNIYKIKKSYIQ